MFRLMVPTVFVIAAAATPAVAQHYEAERIFALEGIHNHGSSVECIRLANGNWVLVCNDTVRGRHSLTALLSDDEGATWKWKRHLELWKPGEGSASYRSVMQARDGSIHATYSYSPKGQGSCIKHAKFDEEWIRQGDPETR